MSGCDQGGRRRDSAAQGVRRWMTAAAFVALAGCGGNDLPQCYFLNNYCNVDQVPDSPVIAVSPVRMTVQVGGTATFVAIPTVAGAAYQWQRSMDGGQTYVDITGATGASFTIAGAQLADDGAKLLVDLRIGGASVSHAVARLSVSSMPGVVFQDGEFASSDWMSTVIASPAQNGPTRSEEQVATGGTPGAFRRMLYSLTPGPSSLVTFNTSQRASYDPQAQGAIHVIDFTEDCIVASPSSGAISVASNLLVEQGARRYVARGSDFCSSRAWLSLPPKSSLGVADLVQIDGPACAVGEACPDFSGSAAPLRFGYVRGASLAASAPANAIVHGIDNWTVTVWRR